MQQPSTTVRLLIFSGRPDPEWTLDDAARDDLSRRFSEAIGKEKSNPPPPGGLGYRGFLVKTRGGFLFGAGGFGEKLPTEFTVFRGVLSVREGRRAEYWRDLAGIEELLLSQARERGYGEALERFGAPQRG